ncbi:MAG TPA: DUF1722 domain-containing protein [Gammaproteobacteria bacterium]|nr:DUF1722 domain-containing protein [Gammaproteobacteria bacterium]
MDKQSPEIRIGVSACLVGHKVRYDGGHKQDNYILHTLSRYFKFVEICPEVELGLGTPREPIQLRQQGESVRLVAVNSGRDLTGDMQQYARKRVRQLHNNHLHGYLFKRASPSCGISRVKIYQQKGAPKHSGVGVYAQTVMERWPNLPVEEEGRLNDSDLRVNWITRVFAYAALQNLWSSSWRLGKLVEFHTRYKFVLLSHSEKEYRQMGQLVAEANKTRPHQLKQEYEQLFMSALRKKATTRKHTNVLQHMVGFFKKELGSRERQALVESIEDYRQGYVPLIVPITLIRHYVAVLGISYLSNQVYLNPYPKELALMNHV